MKHLNIGDTVYWVEASSNFGKEVPCAMCFGKRFVTIILGDNSKQEVECGFCQRGCEKPSGTAKTWEPEAKVYCGTITGISIKDGVRYEVGYKSLWHHEVIETKELAEEVRKLRLEEVKEQAKQFYLDNFVRCKQKQIWSAGYHRNCIKEYERKIEWHKERLNMIKNNK